MKNLKPLYRVLIGFGILFIGGSSGGSAPYPINILIPLFFCIAFLVWVIICLRVKYVSPASVKAAQQAERAKVFEAECEERRKAAEEFAAEQKRIREEFDAKHGRFVTSIAGVTFRNDDGTERQRILKDLYVNGAEGELALEPYDYKGTEAVAVLMNGDCIGNIPKHRLAEYSEIADRLERAMLDVTVFTPDEDEFDDGSPKPERIYRADLTIIYKK